MARCIFINSKTQSLEYLEIRCLKDIQNAVGGIASKKAYLGKSDYILVNPMNSKDRSIKHGFRLANIHDFRGSALITSFDLFDQISTPFVSLETISIQLEWLDFSNVTNLDPFAARRFTSPSSPLH